MLLNVPNVIHPAASVTVLLLIIVRLVQLWVQLHTIFNMELIPALIHAQKANMPIAHPGNVCLVIVTAKLVKMNQTNVHSALWIQELMCFWRELYVFRIVLKDIMKRSMVLLAKPARMGVPLAMSLN